MITIGITGSISSGKTTVAQFIAEKKYPLFSADKVVSDLYKNNKFVKLIVKKFNMSNQSDIKSEIKSIIKKNKEKLKVLESIIHPFVRKEMSNFLKKKNKFIVLEIPLLIESKLNKHFDKIIFVDAKKSLRLKRYIKRNDDVMMFETLNKRQLLPSIKKKVSDIIIINNYSLATLRKNVRKFMENYE